MSVNDIDRNRAIVLANYIHCSDHEWPTVADIPLLCHALLHEVDQNGDIRAELAAATARAVKAEAQADRRERCINKLAIIANANGWDGVNNSKILEVFIGNEFDALRARVAELEGAIGHLKAVWNEWPPKSESIAHAIHIGNALEQIDKVLARQPAQSLAAIKAAALRGLKPLCRGVGYNERAYVMWDRIESEAERLEKETK